MNDFISAILSIKDLLSTNEKVISVTVNENKDEIKFANDRIFVIPDYQREIRWEKENIETLIRDIAGGSKLLGNIILNQVSLEEYDVIDGQQRITSILLLIGYLNSFDIDKFPACKISIESFKGFSELYDKKFDVDDNSLQEIDQTDWYHQRERYQDLWVCIEENVVINAGSARAFMEKLLACTLNVIIKRNANSHDIDYFLDFNFKGVLLDEEDIFKAYLFKYNQDNKTRELWKDIKKEVYELAVRDPKIQYPMTKLFEQYFYCTLYNNSAYPNIEFNNKFQLKKEITIDMETFSKKSHIIPVINSNSYMKKMLINCHKYLLFLKDVQSSNTITAKFKNLVVNEDSYVQENLFSMLRQISCVNNLAPKVMLLKFYIDVLLDENRPRKAYEAFYVVYVKTVFFVMLYEQKGMFIFKPFFKENNWRETLEKTIREDLSEKIINDLKLTLREYNNKNDRSYEFLSRAIATIYNYFYYDEQSDRIKINNHDELHRFNNKDIVSLEHFIINKNGKFDLGNHVTKEYPKRIFKYVDNVFNFIFIPRDLNNKLGNRFFIEKIYEFRNNSEYIEKIECLYSKQIILIAMESFPRAPELQAINNVDDKSELIYNYLRNDFIEDFKEFSSKVVENLYGDLLKNNRENI